MNTLLNPRAVPGSNQAPDYLKEITDQLGIDYADMANRATELLGTAREMPEELEDDAALKAFSDVIVDMRDTIARAETTRKSEKEPYFRKGQAVDGFFNGIAERLTKGMNVLAKRVNTYQQKKLAAERERLRLEAERQAREAREAREKAEREQREAEEARLAAERARKPETQETKGAVASEKEDQAGAARAAADIAADNAEAARIDTLRKPSEIARTRFDEGRLVTMKQVGYVEIIDKMQLDKEALWPFLKDDDVLKALRAWAKTTSHKKPMTGAIVELRDESVIR